MNEQIKHKFKRGEGEKLAAGQITWEQFVTCNNDARGVRYKFEDLSRQLFTYEFLSQNKKHKYVHSNPNNPGIESEPILDEKTIDILGTRQNFLTRMRIIIKSKNRQKKQLSTIREGLTLFIYFVIKHLRRLVMVIKILRRC